MIYDYLPLIVSWCSVTPSSGLANSGDTDYAQLVPRDSNQQASSVQFRGDPDRASKEAAKRRAECQKIPICEMLESGPNM